jgi:hypothetical protein
MYTRGATVVTSHIRKSVTEARQVARAAADTTINPYQLQASIKALAEALELLADAICREKENA